VKLPSSLLEQLQADGKKTALLGGLLLVLIGVVIWRLSPASEPRTAEAAPAVASALPAAAQPASAGTSPTMQPVPTDPSRPGASGTQAPVSQPLGGSVHRSGAAAMERSPVDSEIGAAVCVTDMPRVLHRDLFDFATWERQLPRLAEADGGHTSKAGGGSLWKALGQTLAAQREARRKARAAHKKELMELRLQSTMTGRSPLAYISGRLVREGDVLRGFAVVKIDDRRVILRKAGLDHQLSMP